jgi:hypothetical protein
MSAQIPTFFKISMVYLEYTVSICVHAALQASLILIFTTNTNLIVGKCIASTLSTIIKFVVIRA